jgi:integrase
VLSIADAQKLMQVAKESRVEALIIIAVTTGMRRGELLGLRWNDVDLERGVLHIRRTMNRIPGFGFIENDPKTKAGRRKVTLPDIVVEALKRHREGQEEVKQKLGTRWRGKGLVFCNTVGGFWNPEKMTKVFHKVLDQAGLPYMRFHDLRHSAATILLTMGVHPKVVQELLGHSTIAMTMDIYSHFLPSMQKDAMDKMNDTFK